MKSTLKAWGNSQGILIPKQLTDSLGLKMGAEVEISLSAGESKITIAPAHAARPVRGRHNIEDLIARSSPDAFEGELDWGEPQEKEIW